MRAQESARPRGDATIVARRITGAIRIDGRLDEAEWTEARVIPRLVQVQPRENIAESNSTEIRVLVGEDALYIGARMYEQDPSAIRRRVARRDDPQDGDAFDVFIDSRHDHLTAYHFRLSAGGAMYDGQVTAQGTATADDASWDAVWDGVARVDSAGWTAELRIPFSQVGYSRGHDQEWGIHFRRYSWNRQELDQYPFWSLREADSPARYAHITIPGELPAVTPLEVRPYAATQTETRRVDPRNTLLSGHTYRANAGVDLRYRATTTSVLNLTLNPDFGQVEVDPAVVNLTPFETFFPEKRPFFVEGQNFFSFANSRSYNLPLPPPTMYFSRRIGRAPQLAPAAYDFVDEPSTTHIIGAAKLTGRANNASFGLLEAVTSPEHATYLLGGARRSALAEPTTNYFVMRGTKEINRGLVRTGYYLSAVDRSLGDSVAAAQLRSSAYVGGFDFSSDFANRVWLLDVSATGTMVRGTPAAITRTQRAVNHYYQRPDARFAHLDTSRTSLAGSLIRTTLTKGSGSWLGSFSAERWTPGLELNDLGFQLRSSRYAFSTDVHYLQTRRHEPVQWWTVGWQEGHVWNFDGDRMYNRHALITNVEFTNASRLLGFFELKLPASYEFLTRGGPMTEQPRTMTFNVSYETDRRKALQLIPYFNVIRFESGDQDMVAQIPLAIRPTSSFNMRVAPTFHAKHGVSELLGTRAGGPAATYGVWYDFGQIRQREWSMETRVNVTPTPKLSLQVYAQPLLSSAIYTEYLSLARSRSYDFQRYTGPARDADFTFRSLRGNAVLRWEYRPGSSAYFVWQQDRNAFADVPADVSPARDGRELFGIVPHNVFSIKIAHWVGR